MNIINKKILLCRPEGGLNDKFSQIEKCAKYAENFKRVLIVDTNYEYSHTFKDELSNYFVSKNKNLILSAKKYLDELSGMNVYPKILHGRLNKYSPYYCSVLNKYLDSDSNQVIGFENIDYSEQLIVHHQCGGVPHQAKDFFNRVCLADVIYNELLHRLEIIGGIYSGVHIRNTDMKTNYQTAILDLKKIHLKKLFIATDNINVLEDFRKVFGEKIFSFSFLPEKGGEPIHYFRDKATAFVRNRDAILDLLMLSKSSDLHIYKVSNNIYSEYSGYSRLAHLLHNDQQYLEKIVSRDLP